MQMTTRDAATAISSISNPGEQALTLAAMEDAARAAVMARLSDADRATAQAVLANMGVRSDGWETKTLELEMHARQMSQAIAEVENSVAEAIAVLNDLDTSLVARILAHLPESAQGALLAGMGAARRSRVMNAMLESNRAAAEGAVHATLAAEALAKADDHERVRIIESMTGTGAVSALLSMQSATERAEILNEMSPSQRVAVLAAAAPEQRAGIVAELHGASSALGRGSGTWKLRSPPKKNWSPSCSAASRARATLSLPRMSTQLPVGK